MSEYFGNFAFPVICTIKKMNIKFIHIGFFLCLFAVIKLSRQLVNLGCHLHAGMNIHLYIKKALFPFDAKQTYLYIVYFLCQIYLEYLR